MNKEQVPSEFYMILDQCLDAVVSGQLTLAECLERYPEYADLLKPELQIALLTSRLKSPDMEGAQVEALEMRLRAKMDTQRPRSNNIIYLGRLPISRMAAAILITFMLAFGSGAGLVAASADSVPGETLYPVKRLWEEILLFLASLTGQTDDVWLHLAEVRLDEVLALYQRGDLDENTLRDLYEATGNAIRYADTDTVPKTVNYLNRAEQSLEQVNPPPPLVGLLGDVRRIMLPTYDANGLLQPPSSALPPSLLVTPLPAATATDVPIQASPTATLTAEPTLTTTDTPTLTLTPTATNTPTPLIPATATNTPTPTPSPTRTPSPTVTPTATWTELPIPVGPSATPDQFPTSSQPTSVSGATATSTPSDPNYWLRETQRAVYMTQTAGPPTTEEPSP